MLRTGIFPFKPLSSSCLRSVRTAKPLVQTSTRRYLSERSKPDPDKGPRFRNFIAIGIISYVILAQVVEAVNKQNPRPKSMSESEYIKQQMKLKRRKALFTQEQKSVWFIKSDDSEGLKSLKIDGYEIIDPSVLLDHEKQDKDSLYHALLNDPTFKIPTGLVVDLIAKKLQASEGTKFIVINYPDNIKESVKFEERIVTIKKLIHLTSNEGSKSEEDDVVKYYKTVNKVEDVQTDEELSKLLE